MAVEKKEAKPKTVKKAKKEAELIVETTTVSKPKRTAKPAVSIDKAIEDAIVDVEAAEVVEAKDEVSTTSTAKAGKRSAKALKEAEEQVAKEERKAEVSQSEDKEKPKVRKPVKPARSRLERRGKKFREVAKLIDNSKTYNLKDALELAVKTSPVKFDASVELHINLLVDPKQADQNVRGTLVLPAGTGRTIRIAAFTDDKVVGADVSGVETITKSLEKGEINFDTLIAPPANMPKLGKYARLLGPRGLMPNPKSGTVTTDIKKAVEEAKAGRAEYRVDSTGIVHLSIGKVSFGPAKLMENAEAVVASVRSNKPASVKGAYIKVAHITTTMGPSIKLNLTETSAS